MRLQALVRVFLFLIFTGLTLAACNSSQTEPVTQHPLLGQLKHAVPRISIATVGGQAVETKDTYIEGTLDIDGDLEYADYTGPIGIRGRGNSTWAAGLASGKKPYRLHLDAEAELLGLPAGQNWILLANYLDVTLMGNVIAFATAHLLEMPFTNHMIPVELFMNDEYAGSYLFTEHKEVAPNRIDVGESGVLLELDVHFDEQFQFVSDVYELPVLVQHPKLSKIPQADADESVAQIKADFAEFERALAGGESSVDAFSDLFDRESLAKFMIVIQLTANKEVNHPKSVYMYRVDDGPYHMGPVWDFDWAYGYDTSNRRQFVNPQANRLLSPNSVGGAFFQALMDDADTRLLFQTEWESFYEHQFPILLEYIKEYGAITRDAYGRDYAKWHTKPEQIARSSDFDAELERILDWLEARAEYINEFVGDM